MSDEQNKSVTDSECKGQEKVTKKVQKILHHRVSAFIKQPQTERERHVHQQQCGKLMTGLIRVCEAA